MSASPAGTLVTEYREILQPAMSPQEFAALHPVAAVKAVTEQAGVMLRAQALPPEQVVRPLFQAPLLLLAPFLVASQLVAVTFRKGWFRSLIPLVATLLLDSSVEAGAGLTIAFPAGLPEIGDGGSRSRSMTAGS